MKRLAIVPVALSAALLLFPPAPAAADPRPAAWQEGVLASRKTVTVDHTTLRREYVYRVQSPAGHYVVVSREPIALDLHVPTRFTVAGKRLVILDAAGRQCRTDIVPGPSNRLRR